MSESADALKLAEGASIQTSAPERGLFRRLLRTPVGFLCISWISLVAFVAVFGSFLAPFDPSQTDPRNADLPPFEGEHWLGTDDAGRDVLSRLIEATQTSALAVLLTLGIGLLVGVVTGVIAGFFAGWFDQVSNWITGLIMAMPGLVLLLAARTVLGPSILVAMALFGIIVSPSFYRLVSVTVRSVRNEPYVDAARVTGLSDSRIITNHVLRVVRGPIIIQASIIASVSIAVLAGLAIIGFGDINSVSWGTMLSTAFGQIYTNRWLLLWPALVVSLTSLSFALLGSLLRDELEGGARASQPGRRRRKQALVDAEADEQRAGDLAPTTVEGLAAEEFEFGPGLALDDVPVADDDSATTIVAGTIQHPLPTPIDPLLSINGLVVSYPSGHGWTDVVQGVDLEVGRGEVLGLVGESGSGKTQTAFAVMGLLSVGGQVRKGSIVFDGNELVGNTQLVSSMRGRRISYIPQEPMTNLDPSFTIGSQLVEPLRVCLEMNKDDAKARALELLERVHIPNPERVFKSYPHQLSGGMAQRVLIAGAVSSQPDLIIADEPTTALDVTVQAEILDLLREIQRDLNTSLLLVTHNFGVVADIAERVAVMQRGRIVETGPVREIFHNAEHPYTQSLMAAILDNHPSRPAYQPQDEEVSS